MATRARDDILAGPRFMSASVAELEDWLSCAPKGASFIYGRGPVVDQKRDVVVRVRSLIEEREVMSHQRKVDGEWQYYVVRRYPERGSDKVKAVAMPAPETPAGRVLAILLRCQRLGLPARTNTEIAREMGLKNAEAARYLFNQLVEQKVITVQSMGVRERRVVSFVGTGKSTVRGPL